mgnify:CR=1 FL=1
MPVDRECHSATDRSVLTFSLFTPTIIAALGHWSTPQSLLLSTPRTYHPHPTEP